MILIVALSVGVCLFLGYIVLVSRKVFGVCCRIITKVLQSLLRLDIHTGIE
jgi:hypothetical protein